MPLLSAGLLGAPTSEALGFGFDWGITGGWLGGVAAVFGPLVFEFLDSRRERGHHLSLLVKLSGESLDEIDNGINALFVNRYDGFTRHHG